MNLIVKLLQRLPARVNLPLNKRLTTKVLFNWVELKAVVLISLVDKP